ncbi:hypothetical protein HK098_006413, partial [Nowakowskiella sp. JEL0407]
MKIRTEIKTSSPTDMFTDALKFSTKLIDTYNDIRCRVQRPIKMFDLELTKIDMKTAIRCLVKIDVKEVYEPW